MGTVCERDGESGPASATPTPTKPAHLRVSLMELGVGTLPRGDDCLAKTHRILLRETFPLLFPAHSVYNPSIYFPLTRARGRDKSETGRQERSNPPPQLISAILPIHRGATQHFVKNQSAAVSQRQMNESIHSINPSSQGCWQEMYDPLWMLVKKSTYRLFVSVNSHTSHMK